MDNGRHLDQLLTEAVSDYPEGKIKTVDGSGKGEKESNYTETSFSQLGEQVARLGAAFKERGLGQGDKIAIIGKPHPRWAAVFFAIQRIGAIAVPVAADITSQEIRRILQESEATFLAVEPESQGMVQRVIDLLPQLEDVLVYKGDPEEGFLSWDSFLTASQLEGPRSDSPANLAAIMYTSGTTGDAKGVTLSHRNLTINAFDIDHLLDLSPEDNAASILPWYHIYGLTVSLLTPLTAGVSILYTDQYRNLSQVLKENEATILLAVPKLFNVLYEEVRKRIEANLFSRVLDRLAPWAIRGKVKESFAGSQLRFAVSGGAPLDPEVAKGLRRLGIGIYEGYGLTETSPVITWTPDPFTRKEGSVGQSLPHVRMKIRDGEVIVKGPTVMGGYYKNPDRTAEIIDEEGWLHTGDSGQLDEDGWLYLNGRQKNVIVLPSGNNVYPEEVEWELERLPYLKEVLVKERQRKGRPVVAASIYPSYGALSEEKGLEEPDEIKDFVWSQVKEGCKNLAAYKRIKSKKDLKIMQDPFEKTPTLKIKRYLYQDEEVHN